MHAVLQRNLNCDCSLCGEFIAVQKAHVGIGISGVEGLQAACASDYSIAQVSNLFSLFVL